MIINLKNTLISLLIIFVMWPLEYIEPCTGVHYMSTGQSCSRGVVAPGTMAAEVDSEESANPDLRLAWLYHSLAG